MFRKRGSKAVFEGKRNETEDTHVSTEYDQPEQSSQSRPSAKRAVRIAPVLRPSGQRSALSDGLILLSRGETIDLEAAERFRILRGQLERKALQSGTAPRITAVTSAVPGEGKSVVSVNLARAFGTDPRGKSLIIDCDLRKPNVHRFFDQMQSPGLSDVLLAGKSIRSVLRSVESGLDLITAGSPVVDSTRTIEQPGMALLLEELKKHYQYIILDCPPALFCSEPIALTQLANSALLVVRSWRTEKKLVKDAVNLIGKKTLAGIILNDCSDTVNQYGYYGYYGYDKEAIARAKSVVAERNRGSGKPASLFSRLFSKRDA